MLTNVNKECITVISMPCVKILMEVITVSVNHSMKAME